MMAGCHPVQADRPFLGVCLGMQLLFEGSEESGGCEGLGLIPGQVSHFDTRMGLPVPHIGWNDLIQKCVSGWSGLGGVSGLSIVCDSSGLRREAKACG